MVVSAEEYRHKIFGVIPSPDHQTIYSDTDMAAEPKGTLTPPGSSPLRAECDPRTDSSPGSTPPSPQPPPTPDSAHMVAEPANQGAARLQFANEQSEGHILTNEEPLAGAKKRKPTKVHKVEAECGSEGEAEAGLGGSFVCPVCQEVLASQHDFTQHIRKHNHVIEADNGTKVYVCGICQKQLSSNSSLDRHMLVHSGERPFRCHICGTHFTTNGNMHRHIRGHYRNGGPGSDSGDSDLGSEEGSPSPYKRPHDEDEAGGPSKLVRLEIEEELACPACGEEQGSQHSLEQHVETVHPEYQVTCSHCQVVFKNYRALHLHNSMVHPTAVATPPQLDLTRTDFSTSKFPLIAKQVCEAGSRQGEAVGEGAGLYKCPRCFITFPCSDSWVMHMREHTAAATPPPTPLRCVRCDLSFSSVADLAQHHQRHLCEESQPRKESFLAVLDLLNKQSREGSLLGGLRPPLGLPPPGQHSPAPADSAKASPEHPTASRIAAPHTTAPGSMSPVVSGGSLLSHEEQFAREYRDMKLNGQYPCRLCKEVFANLRKLKSHNLVHMVAPPYRCNLCSFYSNDKNTLKEHMKSHKGDTPYECNLCNLAFTTKANCERHIKNIHGCGSRDEVKKCMKYHPTEDSTIGDPSQDTICHICHIDCKARSVLRDHIRSSHPEGMTKPFSCRLCGGAFPSENDVMRHVIQQHSEAASGATLEQLVVTRVAEERHREHPDLTPVESLLNIKLPMAVPLSAPHQPPPPALPLPFPHKSPVPISMVTHRPHTPTLAPIPLIPSLPSMPPMSSDSEDAPLDLSMSSKREKGQMEEEEDIDIEAGDVKQEQEEPEDLSKPRKEREEEPEAPGDSPEHTPEVLKIPRPPFSLSAMYPQSLPMCGPYPSSQYPMLMEYNIRPPFESTFIEEYQKKIRRGLQLTSGGSLLSGASLLQHNSTSFPLSALALAATHRNPLRIPDIRSVEIKQEEAPVTDTQGSSGPKPSDDDVMHFTMRNSVLMKKPKQRRYRTERPWRCDLCDKGFTLRSNMERHMKQQHPDVWQQRPRGVSTPRSDTDSAPLTPADPAHTISSSVRQQLISKIEKDSGDEAKEEAPRLKEEEENELIIDDVPEKNGVREEEEEEGEEEEEEEEDEEDCEEEHDQEGKSAQQGSEDSNADLASVHTLLSTASNQSFPFFGSEGEEDAPCEDDSMSNTSQPEEGKKSAYSSAPQKQKCPFCQRKFPWSSSLVRHIRTHTGQKPYLCPVCHFPFTTKSNCDRHLLRKHPDSPHSLGGDRPHRCTKCPGAAFSNLESLRKHEMFRHEKASDTAVPRDDTRPFRCHVCEAPLATREAAHLHLRKAHPENFRCIVNTEPVTTDNNNDPLSPSPDTTTTEKVSCMFCLTRYWSLAELKQHVVKHHMAPSPQDGPEDEHKEPDSPSTEDKEERREEAEGSDFISDLLGTKRAVVDRLLTSKSADDAAKLLGVR